MRAWSEKKPDVMRIFEFWDIPEEDLPAAKAGLDGMMRAWADKYHKRGAPMMAVQMVFGEKNDQVIALSQQYKSTRNNCGCFFC